MNVVNPAKSTRWIAASITSRMSMVTRVSISVKPPSALRRGRRRPMKPVRYLPPGLVDAGCGFNRITVVEDTPIGRVGGYLVLVGCFPFEMSVDVLHGFICGVPDPGIARGGVGHIAERRLVRTGEVGQGSGVHGRFCFSVRGHVREQHIPDNQVSHHHVVVRIFVYVVLDLSPGEGWRP